MNSSPSNFPTTWLGNFFSSEFFHSIDASVGTVKVARFCSSSLVLLWCKHHSFMNDCPRNYPVIVVMFQSWCYCQLNPVKGPFFHSALHTTTAAQPIVWVLPRILWCDCHWQLECKWLISSHYTTMFPTFLHGTGVFSQFHKSRPRLLNWPTDGI